MLRLFRHHVPLASALQLLLDFIVFFSAVQIAGLIQLVPYGVSPTEFAVPGVTFALVMTAVCAAVGLYQSDTDLRFGVFLGRAVLAAVAGFCATYLLFELVPGGKAVQKAAWFAALFSFAGIVGLRKFGTLVRRVSPPTRRALIVGTGREAAEVAEVMASQENLRCEIVGFYEAGGEPASRTVTGRVFSRHSDLQELVDRLGVSEVVVAVREQRGGVLPMRELLECRISGVAVMDLAGFYERVRGQVPVESLKASWLIYGQGFAQGALRTFVKRLFDYLSASALFVVSLPVMLLAAIAIRIESPGPVIYRQERVGLGGRKFMCLKFRSMRADAEAAGTAIWAGIRDPRVTRVGRIIRKFRIDELPQLVNVLKGDMSFVGPRPERPCFVAQLKEQIRFYDVRHSVKPGLTGWAQVRYTYGASVEDSTRKLQFDLYYVKNHSLFLDMLILVETVRVVLFGEGAR